MDSEDRQEQAPGEEVPGSDVVGSEGPQEEMLAEEAPRISAARFNRIAVLALAVVALCIVVAVLWSRRPDKPNVKEPVTTVITAKEESPLLALCDRLIGEPSAKVKVIAVLPFSAECKDEVGLYLASVCREFPSMVSVMIVDIGSERGKQVMKEHGIGCATVLVNGKSRFDLGPRIADKLELERMALCVEDVRRALAAELKEAYGDSAPELPPVPAESPGHDPLSPYQR